jgi:hypothetical protein
VDACWTPPPRRSCHERQSGGPTAGLMHSTDVGLINAYLRGPEMSSNGISTLAQVKGFQRASPEIEQSVTMWSWAGLEIMVQLRDMRDSLVCCDPCSPALIATLEAGQLTLLASQRSSVEDRKMPIFVLVIR